MDVRAELSAIASAAAGDIERYAGADNKWAKMLRDTARDPKLSRGDLHSLLRTVADMFVPNNKDLARSIEQHRQAVDGLPR